MSYNNVPDYRLDPPEDSRRAVYRCAICRDSILEGDDFYDLPVLGICCEECVEGSKCFGAELDDPEPDREEDYLDE